MTTKNTIIREATSDDLGKLLEFEQGVIRAERPFDEVIKPDPAKYYDITEMIKNENVALAVAEIEGRVIGSGYARIQPSKIYHRHSIQAYLGFMFVQEEFRGLGINHLLINYLLSWAKKKGISYFNLDVYAENYAAIKAYEKAGFKASMINMRLEIKK